MRLRFDSAVHDDPSDLRPPVGGVALWWLGQAGFLIEGGCLRIVIDAYLSDSLAKKYRGKHFPHVRMMPAPVAPEDLRNIDWLLCTHGHTDHMDADTIGPLVRANPAMRVLVPRSELTKARDRAAPQDRLVGIDAGETVDLGGATLTATPAAHEELAKDADGAHLFLGYALTLVGITLWHSGDTIPFDGLVEAARAARVDAALLPINGRDADRAAYGVPGNLTAAEAAQLTDDIGAKVMIGHHFGMFDFNTVDPRTAAVQIAVTHPKADTYLATTNTAYIMSKHPVDEIAKALRRQDISLQNETAK